MKRKEEKEGRKGWKKGQNDKRKEGQKDRRIEGKKERREDR